MNIEVPNEKPDGTDTMEPKSNKEVDGLETDPIANPKEGTNKGEKPQRRTRMK